ncbi:MAG: hypothetical protein ABSA10_00135 [Anaerolineales bacterium]|jgi:hypothetical protein
MEKDKKGEWIKIDAGNIPLFIIDVKALERKKPEIERLNQALTTA